MKVLKFGGSSVGSVESMKRVVKIIESFERPAVVVSAMKGETDHLLQIFALLKKKDEKAMYDEMERFFNKHVDAASKLIDDPQVRMKLLVELSDELKLMKDGCRAAMILSEFSPKVQDFIVSFGEKFSARMLSAALRSDNNASEYVSAEDIICTDDRFGEASPIYDKSMERMNEVFSRLPDRSIPLITGFIGSTIEGVTTTIGRNGSDFSAAIIGYLIDAEEILIYTDVDGIFSTDPNVLKSARIVEEISYEEAFEMSFFGAKVLHPKTILPAVEKNIPVRILNTFNPENPGSVIKNVSRKDGIKVISLIKDVAMINVMGRGMQGVPGISARTFACAHKAGANILMISQSAAEQKISFVVPKKDGMKVKIELEREFAAEILRRDVSGISEEDGSIICLVGSGLRENYSLLSNIFNSLSQVKISPVMLALGASEMNFSIVLKKEDASSALFKLHENILEVVR